MILLFYDTEEKDLARDLQGFLGHVGVTVTMIPREPDKGPTLQAKELLYLDQCEGIVFLITPGSVRKGKNFASPSLNHEMGLAQHKFVSSPEKVIYLLEQGCNLQSIDQKTYISFKRDDMRSVIEVLSMLLVDLKAASILPTADESQQGGSLAEFDESDCIAMIFSWVQNKYGSLGGTTLLYDELDKEIGVPRGASKRYFAGVAEKQDYKVVNAGNKTILLKYLIEEV